MEVKKEFYCTSCARHKSMDLYGRLVVSGRIKYNLCRPCVKKIKERKDAGRQKAIE